MASLLDKVSTLISANLHYMIDQALQNNSPAVIDQYIRQVEANLADLEDAAAAVGGEVKGIQRRLTDQEQKLTEMDRAIDAFLVEGNESAAVAVQSRYNSSKRLVEAYQEQLTRQDEEFKNLLSAKVKLEARLATMKA
jgi:phage shock protein A